MRFKHLFWILVSSLIFAACASGQQSDTPAVAGAARTSGALGELQTAEALQTTGTRKLGAGHLIVTGGTRLDKGCPSGFLACVTVSSYQSAQLEICYTSGSYCGPSEPPYYWYSAFINRKYKGVNDFNGSFNPNPGNPTEDTISETRGVKPTHGKYKYAQLVSPCVPSYCMGLSYIGIAVQ